jgi:hypothetical protein
MSKLKAIKMQLLKITFVFAAMFGLGYFSADYFIQANETVQSTSMSSILMNAKMGKSLSFVNVQLESAETPDSANETAEITGFITLLKTSNNSVSYHWVLPEGAQIVEGALEGNIESVQVEQPVEVKIKIKGYSKSEKKLVSLSASTRVGETAFSNVALISSRPEDSHEYMAKQKFDAKKLEQLELSSESPSDLRSQEAKIQR